MIGSDVLQRLIGATVLLAGERTLRATGSQKSSATSNVPVKGQPAEVSSTAELAGRGQRHFTQASSWASAPFLPADILAPAAPLPVRTEIAIAPVVYLETIADAPAAMRTPDPPPPQATAFTPHVLYPSAELAHALSRTTASPSATTSAEQLAAQKSDSKREKSRSTENQEFKGFAYLAATAAGLVVIAACAAIFLM